MKEVKWTNVADKKYPDMDGSFFVMYKFENKEKPEVIVCDFTASARYKWHGHENGGFLNEDKILAWASVEIPEKPSNEEEQTFGDFVKTLDAGGFGKMIGAFILLYLHKYKKQNMINSLFDTIAIASLATTIDDDFDKPFTDSIFYKYIGNIGNVNEDNNDNKEENTWVFISDRLPEETKAYWLLFKDGKVDIGSFHKDETFGITKGGQRRYVSCKDVDAWMEIEMPEPYKNEEFITAGIDLAKRYVCEGNLAKAIEVLKYIDERK